MSLILDALNKADNERKQNQEETPGIGTLHDVLQAPSPQGGINRRWVVVGIGIFMFLLVCVYLLGRSSSEKPQTAQSQLSSATGSANTPANNKVETTVAQQMSAQQKQGLPDKASTQKLIEAQYQQAARDAKLRHKNKTPALTSTKEGLTEQEKALLNKEENQLAATATSSQTSTDSTNKIEAGAPQVKIKQKNTIGKLYAAPAAADTKPSNAKPSNTNEKNAATTAAKQSEVAPPKSQVRVNEPVNPESLAHFDNIGYLRELSYSAQQKVPTLMYHEHNYKGKTGSSVTLNGKTVREGGKAASGVTVENILIDGIILSFGNEQFKMDAFSSWVNM